MVKWNKWQQLERVLYMCVLFVDAGGNPVTQSVISVTDPSGNPVTG